MGNVILIIQLVIQLLPTVIAAVQAVEALLPAAGQGARKLEMVHGILQSAYDAAGNATLAFEKLWPSLQPAINGVVAVYNATGKFGK